VRHQLVSVSIVAKDCMAADALPTAALVLGEEKTRQAFENKPGMGVLLIHALRDTVD
jgi:thiamine biosynthesis lipoprotein ApbE